MPPLRPFLLSAFSALPVALSAIGPVPPTPKDSVVDVIHGRSVADPYRWLEGSSAPEIKTPDAALDARVLAWTQAQNARTRAYFDSLPGRATLVAKLLPLFRTDSLGTPVTRGGLDFYSRRSGDSTNGLYCVRPSAGGDERVLLDIDKLYPDRRTVLAGATPSHDGKRVAFGLFKSGDENTTLRILDTATGKWLPDVITGKAAVDSWLPGGDAFVYSKLADIKNPYSRRILLHRIGEDTAKDRLIFEQYKTGPLATTYGPGASLDRDGKWLTLSYSTGTSDNDVWVYDFQKWLRTGELVRTTIIEGAKAFAHTEVVGDTMFLHTNDGAPNGRIFRIDLNKPARGAWEEIVTEPKDAVLSGFSLSKSFLAITLKRDALNHIELRNFDGKFVRELSQPGVGSAGLGTDSESDTAYFGFSSFNVPPSTYKVNLVDDKRTLYFRPDYPVVSENYTVEERFYPSKDGTKIPLFLVHRKGLALDGDNPTILYGYGGFSIGQKPGFNPTLLPWLDAGGVFALAGLRGGDEYGEPWHHAGMLANKQNVFDDCIAAAEFLIREKYTSPAHLGVRGGSNGGLLTGAVLTQRPDLFSAVGVGVPLLDMLRYDKFLMAKYWVPEYGDPAKAGDFATLFAYSPYHHVRAGVNYPAVLLEAGEKDSRVHPMHARKMAAALQAATSGDPDSRPILLSVDYDSGHGSGKSFEMRVRDTADTYLFFAKNLGLNFTESSGTKTTVTHPTAEPPRS